MPQIKDITNFLETIAPLPYQESYDNAGLIVGDALIEVTGILVTLDSTEVVVDEAIAKGCNLIVAHHPIVFKGLKKLNGKNYVERTVIKAIKNNVAIFPNPVNDELNISSDLNSFNKYELFDIQGRLIKSESLSNLNNFKINTSSLNKGVYMLSINTNEGSFVEKIVKK